MTAIAATVAEVLVLAPELTDASTGASAARFTLLVDVITPLLVAPPQPAWGDKFSEAHRLVAAHFLTLEFNPGAVGGVVNARGIDKISESYSVGTFDDPEYQTTFYGRAFLALQKSCGIQQSRAIVDAVTPPAWCPPDDRRIP